MTNHENNRKLVEILESIATHIYSTYSNWTEEYTSESGWTSNNSYPMTTNPFVNISDDASDDQIKELVDIVIEREDNNYLPLFSLKNVYCNRHMKSILSAYTSFTNKIYENGKWLRLNENPDITDIFNEYRQIKRIHMKYDVRLNNNAPVYRNRFYFDLGNEIKVYNTQGLLNYVENLYRWDFSDIIRDDNKFYNRYNEIIDINDFNNYNGMRAIHYIKFKEKESRLFFSKKKIQSIEFYGINYVVLDDGDYFDVSSYNDTIVLNETFNRYLTGGNILNTVSITTYINNSIPTYESPNNRLIMWDDIFEICDNNEFKTIDISTSVDLTDYQYIDQPYIYFKGVAHSFSSRIGVYIYDKNENGEYIATDRVLYMDSYYLNTIKHPRIAVSYNVITDLQQTIHIRCDIHNNGDTNQDNYRFFVVDNDGNQISNKVRYSGDITNTSNRKFEVNIFLKNHNLTYDDIMIVNEYLDPVHGSLNDKLIFVGISDINIIENPGTIDLPHPYFREASVDGSETLNIVNPYVEEFNEYVYFSYPETQETSSDVNFSYQLSFEDNTEFELKYWVDENRTTFLDEYLVSKRDLEIYGKYSQTKILNLYYNDSTVILVNIKDQNDNEIEHGELIVCDELGNRRSELVKIEMSNKHPYKYIAKILVYFHDTVTYNIKYKDPDSIDDIFYDCTSSSTLIEKNQSYGTDDNPIIFTKTRYITDLLNNNNYRIEKTFNYVYTENNKLYQNGVTYLSYEGDDDEPVKLIFDDKEYSIGISKLTCEFDKKLLPVTVILEIMDVIDGTVVFFKDDLMVSNITPINQVGEKYLAEVKIYFPADVSDNYYTLEYKNIDGDRYQTHIDYRTAISYSHDTGSIDDPVTYQYFDSPIDEMSPVNTNWEYDNINQYLLKEDLNYLNNKFLKIMLKHPEHDIFKLPKGMFRDISIRAINIPKTITDISGTFEGDSEISTLAIPKNIKNFVHNTIESVILYLYNPDVFGDYEEPKYKIFTKYDSKLVKYDDNLMRDKSLNLINDDQLKKIIETNTITNYKINLNNVTYDNLSITRSSYIPAEYTIMTSDNSSKQMSKKIIIDTNINSNYITIKDTGLISLYTNYDTDDTNIHLAVESKSDNTITFKLQNISSKYHLLDEVLKCNNNVLYGTGLNYCDFSELNFRNMSLTSCDLYGVDFTNTQLLECTFENINIKAGTFIANGNAVNYVHKLPIPMLLSYGLFNRFNIIDEGGKTNDKLSFKHFYGNSINLNGRLLKNTSVITESDIVKYNKKLPRYCTQNCDFNKLPFIHGLNHHTTTSRHMIGNNQNPNYTVDLLHIKDIVTNYPNNYVESTEYINNPFYIDTFDEYFYIREIANNRIFIDNKLSVEYQINKDPDIQYKTHKEFVNFIDPNNSNDISQYEMYISIVRNPYQLQHQEFFNNDTSFNSYFKNTNPGGTHINKYGQSIALSSNGNIVAIGSPYQYGFRGHTRVFEWNQSKSTWIQKGDTIVGKSLKAKFGKYVALSADGTILVISAPYQEFGSIVRYEWNGSEWIEKGDIKDMMDNKINNISLSPDGRFVGFIYNEKSKMYEWNGSAWETSYSSGFSVSDITITNDTIIYGENTHTEDEGFVLRYSSDTYVFIDSIDDGKSGEKYKLGTSVAASLDGLTVAISVPYAPYTLSNGFTYTDTGYVKIRSYYNNRWNNKGSVIYGNGTNDKWGLIMCLSGDGNTIAIAHSENTHKKVTKIYKWDGNDWSESSSSLNTTESYKSPSSIALSYDGNIFTVTTTGPTVIDSNRDDYQSRGLTQIYEWNESESIWIQKGNNILDKNYEVIRDSYNKPLYITENIVHNKLTIDTLYIYIYSSEWSNWDDTWKNRLLDNEELSIQFILFDNNSGAQISTIHTATCVENDSQYEISLNDIDIYFTGDSVDVTLQVKDRWGLNQTYDYTVYNTKYVIETDIYDYATVSTDNQFPVLKFIMQEPYDNYSRENVSYLYRSNDTLSTNDEWIRNSTLVTKEILNRENVNKISQIDGYRFYKQLYFLDYNLDYDLDYDLENNFIIEIIGVGGQYQYDDDNILNIIDRYEFSYTIIQKNVPMTMTYGENTDIPNIANTGNNYTMIQYENVNYILGITYVTYQELIYHTKRTNTLNIIASTNVFNMQRVIQYNDMKIIKNILDDADTTETKIHFYNSNQFTTIPNQIKNVQNIYIDGDYQDSIQFDGKYYRYDPTIFTYEGKGTKSKLYFDFVQKQIIFDNTHSDGNYKPYEKFTLKNKNNEHEFTITHTTNYIKDFTYTKYYNTNYYDIEIKSSIYNVSIFNTVNYTNCTLKQLDFLSTQFENVNFTNCNFEDVKFIDSKFKNCNFTACLFKRTEFTKSIIKNTLLIDITVSDVSFISTVFNNTSIKIENIRIYPEQVVYNKFFKYITSNMHVDIIHVTDKDVLNRFIKLSPEFIYYFGYIFGPGLNILNDNVNYMYVAKFINNSPDINSFIPTVFYKKYDKEVSKVYFLDTIYNYNVLPAKASYEQIFINLDGMNLTNMSFENSSFSNMYVETYAKGRNIIDTFSFNTTEHRMYDAIVLVENGKYVFTNPNNSEYHNNFSDNIKYTLYEKEYTFNIPESHPIAILNKDNAYITYTGNDDKKIVSYINRYTVTVVSDNDSNKFVLNHDQSLDLKFIKNSSYIFDQSDSTNTGHPISFDSSDDITLNVTITSYGTPGQSGAYTRLFIPDDVNTVSFNMICTVHGSGMGSYYNPSVADQLDISDRGDQYDFYYGDITVTVTGNFGTLSIYCLYHGYMGGENLLKYKSNDEVSFDYNIFSNDITIEDFQKHLYNTYLKLNVSLISNNDKFIQNSTGLYQIHEGSIQIVTKNNGVYTARSERKYLINDPFIQNSVYKIEYVDVTVDNGSFRFNGYATIKLECNTIYKFDQTHSSNGDLPLTFYCSSDDIIVDEDGTAGTDRIVTLTIPREKDSTKFTITPIYAGPVYTAEILDNVSKYDTWGQETAKVLESSEIIDGIRVWSTILNLENNIPAQFINSDGNIMNGFLNDDGIFHYNDGTKPTHGPIIMQKSNSGIHYQFNLLLGREYDAEVSESDALTILQLSKLVRHIDTSYDYIYYNLMAKISLANKFTEGSDVWLRPPRRTGTYKFVPAYSENIIDEPVENKIVLPNTFIPQYNQIDCGIYSEENVDYKLLYYDSDDNKYLLNIINKHYTYVYNESSILNTNTDPLTLSTDYTQSKEIYIKILNEKLTTYLFNTVTIIVEIQDITDGMIAFFDTSGVQRSQQVLIEQKSFTFGDKYIAESTVQMYESEQNVDVIMYYKDINGHIYNCGIINDTDTDLNIQLTQHTNTGTIDAPQVFKIFDKIIDAESETNDTAIIWSEDEITLINNKINGHIQLVEDVEILKARSELIEVNNTLVLYDLIKIKIKYYEQENLEDIENLKLLYNPQNSDKSYILSNINDIGTSRTIISDNSNTIIPNDIKIIDKQLFGKGININEYSLNNISDNLNYIDISRSNMSNLSFKNNSDIDLIYNFNHIVFENINGNNIEFMGENYDNNTKYLEIKNSSFKNADLSYAIFGYCDLSNTNFENANLSYATFSNCNLNDTNFKNANLSNVQFFYVDLTSAYFENANLDKVSGDFIVPNDFRGFPDKYVLSGKIFGQNINFNNANLMNMNLTNININDSNLNFCKFDKTTRFPNIINNISFDNSETYYSGIVNYFVTTTTSDNSGYKNVIPTLSNGTDGEYSEFLFYNNSPLYILNPGKNYQVSDILTHNGTELNIIEVDSSDPNSLNFNKHIDIFSDKNITNCSFKNCKFSNINFSYSKMKSCNFSTANIKDSCFDNCLFDTVEFTGIQLTNVSFKSVISNNITPSNIDILPYLVRNGTIIGPNIDMFGIDLSNSNVSNINFTNVHSKNITPYDGNGVTLPSGHKIQQGILYGIDVNLYDIEIIDNTIDLHGVNISNAKINNFNSNGLIRPLDGNTVTLPSDYKIINGNLCGRNVILDNQIFEDITFTNIDFSGSSFKNTTFNNVTFGIEGEHIIMKHCDFTNANFIGNIIFSENIDLTDSITGPLQHYPTNTIQNHSQQKNNTIQLKIFDNNLYLYNKFTKPNFFSKYDNNILSTSINKHTKLNEIVVLGISGHVLDISENIDMNNTMFINCNFVNSIKNKEKLASSNASLINCTFV